MTSRLNKRLVDLGLAASRRKADELIQEGGVMVNGEQVTTMATQVDENDVISLFGRTGKVREHIYIAFHKPAGYVCTHRVQTDRQKTIFDLLPLSFASLKLAGRLDKDSQGLMVLSSDGNFIQNLSHPSRGKQKTYLVNLDKPLRQADKARLLSGVKLKDGMSRFVSVSQIKPQLLRVTMSEGKNRQIRRTLEALGYNVRVLERTRLGSLELGLLKPGEHRFINPKDVL